MASTNQTRVSHSPRQGLQPLDDGHHQSGKGICLSTNDRTRFPGEGVYGLSPNRDWDKTCGNAREIKGRGGHGKTQTWWEGS